VTANFAHVHTHTHASAYDGVGRHEEFVAKAKVMGHNAIAFTDHGSLRGLYEAHEACTKHEIKLIPGLEAYLCDDIDRKGLTDEERKQIKLDHSSPEDRKRAFAAEDAKRSDRDHITLWALSDLGLQNLFKLTSISWTKGFYGKPRIDMKLLAEYAEGIAASTGCVSGVVAKPLRDGNFVEAERRLQRLSEIFSGRFYVEIMPHVPPGTEGVPDVLVRWAKQYSLPLIATQDAHYPHIEDALAQKVFLCVKTQSKLSAPKHVFDTPEYWLRSREEMFRAFAQWLPQLDSPTINAALDNTLALADSCSARLQPTKPGVYLAAPPLPPAEKSHESWLKHQCQEGWKSRIKRKIGFSKSEYTDRLNHELKTICGRGFAKYFLMVEEVVSWARGQGIMMSPGRGSAAGSLVSYLLGITQLDPIEHGLSFDRFLSPARVTKLPDIDLDFEAIRREEVVSHLRETYGEDRVSRISTSNTLAGRRALRDVAKVFGVLDSEVTPVANMIVEAIEEEEKQEGSLRDALARTEVGKAFRARHPEACSVALRLEGQIRDVGQHAAGVVASSAPLSDLVPLETRGQGKTRVPVVAFDWHASEAMGLVKLDVLGLKTLTVLREAMERSGASEGEFDREDPSMLDGFSAQKFTGIFQFDTSSARELCRGFTFRRFSDVAAIAALNRPGPARAGFGRLFIERAMGRAASSASKDPDHLAYREITSSTEGVVIYQEQVVEIAKRVAGYTPAEADEFRYKMAKKIGLSDEFSKFTEGAKKCGGMAHEGALELFDLLSGFAQYAFNKSHATAYADLAARLMWLKTHHSAHFFAAALASEDDPEAQRRLVGDAQRLAVPIVPPDVIASQGRFAVRPSAVGDYEIVGALDSIKWVGEVPAAQIASLGPYSDLRDFATRTQGSRVTARVFASLSQATAFRSIFSHTRLLSANSQIIWRGLRSKRRWMPVVTRPGAIGDFSSGELAVVAEQVYPLFTGAFEEVEAKVRATVRRVIITPDEPRDGLLSAIVFGRVSAVKIFAGGDGSKSARVSLTAPGGGEIVARLDPEALAASMNAVGSTGGFALAIVRLCGPGRTYIDMMWRVDGRSTLAVDAQFGAPANNLFAKLANPPSTSPAKLDEVWAGIPSDGSKPKAIGGVVIRLERKMSKKSGSPYVRIMLLGRNGVLPIFAFRSRINDEGVTGLVPGNTIERMRVKKQGDMAVLCNGELTLT